MTTDDAHLRALINESERNQRTNPAVEAEQRHKPTVWTPEMERELLERLHGTDAQRLDALIAAENERIRRS